MYQVTARNFSTATENRIHSDDVAQRYGFRGGLVPGVAVWGHLTHPVVERLGDAWLGRGQASVRFIKPAYHGDRLDIDLTEDGDQLVAVARNAEGELLAELRTQPDAPLPEPEDQSPLARDPKLTPRGPMTWDTIQEGQPLPPWQQTLDRDGNALFAERVADTLPVYERAVHPHWLLGLANTQLTRDYEMPAWIHVGSEIRFRRLLEVGDLITIRAVMLEKWRRKGHEFLRAYLSFTRDDEITTEIFHTAIYSVAERT